MNKLISVLRNIKDFTWSDALFLPEDEVWGTESKCLVWNPDDIENEEDEVPKIALENGLMYALGIQTVMAIVDNYYETHDRITDNGLVDAFLYYYDNDAFIK